MSEKSKGSLFQIFRHYVTVETHFFCIFENFVCSEKDSKRSPFSVLTFCNKMDVKKSQTDFSKGIISVLKLGFLRPSTLCPIFFSMTSVFMRVFFLICFHRSSPQFLPETKRSRFSALCDFTEEFQF